MLPTDLIYRSNISNTKPKLAEQPTNTSYLIPTRLCVRTLEIQALDVNSKPVNNEHLPLT